MSLCGCVQTLKGKALFRGVIEHNDELLQLRRSLSQRHNKENMKEGLKNVDRFVDGLIFLFMFAIYVCVYTSLSLSVCIGTNVE